MLLYWIVVLGEVRHSAIIGVVFWYNIKSVYNNTYNESELNVSFISKVINLFINRPKYNEVFSAIYLLGSFFLFDSNSIDYNCQNCSVYFMDTLYIFHIILKAWFSEVKFEAEIFQLIMPSTIKQQWSWKILYLTEARISAKTMSIFVISVHLLTALNPDLKFPYNHKSPWIVDLLKPLTAN